MDVVEQFIPVTYPRVLKDSKEEVDILGWSAVAAGCFATLLVIWTSGMVLRYRKKRSLVYAQIEFLGLLLAGSFGTYLLTTEIPVDPFGFLGLRFVTSEKD